MAVDGVPFQDMANLQNGTWIQSENNSEYYKGFSQFFPVSKMISVYPSESDVSWADILHLVPPKGYQRYYYSYANNTVVGKSGLSDISELAEYEKSMNWRLEGIIEHLSCFLFPQNSFTDELKTIEDKFFATDDAPIFYAYVISTDDIQHMGGNVLPLLRQLDQMLARVQARYRELIGEKLEIALISDHGNNHSFPGIRVGVEEFLVNHGYKIADKLNDINDVVIPTSGIMNVFKVYADKGHIAPLASELSSLEGVDLITFQLDNAINEVYILKPDGQMAVVHKKTGTDLFSYKAIKGDPLNYQSVLDKLKDANLLQEKNYAHAQDWLQYTIDEYYPMAPERIIRGHQETVLNPSPLIVSLKNGYEHVDPWTKRMSQIVTTGGTHGALDKYSSNGILMTNFSPTQNTSTDRLWKQLGKLPSLHDYHLDQAGIEVVSGELLAKSARNDFIKQEKYVSLFSHQKDGVVHFWFPELKDSPENWKIKIQISDDDELILSKVFSKQKKNRDLVVGAEGVDFYYPLQRILQRRLKSNMKLYFDVTIDNDETQTSIPTFNLETNENSKVVVF